MQMLFFTFTTRTDIVRMVDNFPSFEYEFITTQYQNSDDRWTQFDRDIYKDELFYTLIICYHCNTVVALYNVPWCNKPLIYQSHCNDYYAIHYTCKNRAVCYNRRPCIEPRLKGCRISCLFSLSKCTMVAS